MNILVTGAKGMVGTALVNNLKNIRDGKNKTRKELHIDEIYEYDLNSTPAELDEYCQKADFVFNLAGVNRPENPEDFMKGNFGFAFDLLNCLKKHNIRPPSCCLRPFRQLWPDALATASMAAARRRVKSCSSIMPKKLVQKWRSIVFRI